MTVNDTLNSIPLKGHCVCKTVTYTLTSPPMITHCCHCTYCQQETGSAFALNAVIECYNFSITSPKQPLISNRPSPSSLDGSKHLVAYCPNRNCNTDIFAHYSGNKATVYVKAGTLDEQSRKRVKPDVHIFTSSKVEWVDLKSEAERGVPICEEFYDRKAVWNQENIQRLEKLRAWAVQQEAEGVKV